MIKALIIYTQFFSRIVIPKAVDISYLRLGLPFLTLFGLLLGLISGGFYFLTSLVLPGMVAWVLTLAFDVLLTGGFHLDALADTADGLFSSRKKERMLEIMKEHKEVRLIFRIKLVLGFLTSFISLRQFTRLTESIYSLCKDNKSRYLSVPSGRKHYFGEMFIREDMQLTRKLNFEGHKWNVPNNIEHYLTVMYGDYMIIPAVEDRESHIILEISFPNE